MQLSSRSFRDGGTIPGEFSFAVINPAGLLPVIFTE
jgi:hypothetical protein